MEGDIQRAEPQLDVTEPVSPNVSTIFPKWEAIKGSVIGASHRRAGLPYQDAVGHRTYGKAGSECPLGLAVADGHGSARSFRSDVGAQLAVQSVLDVLSQYFGKDDCSSQPSIPEIHNLVKERIPRDIEKRWKESVDKKLVEKPITEEELATLTRKAGHAGRAAVDKNKHLVYGTTVLAILITTEVIFCLQLGDGEIMVVDDKGGVTRPIPRDPNFLGDQTTSLCQPEAWRLFRTIVQRLEDRPPALILLSTDGYPNSFETDGGFLQVGSDLLNAIYQHGIHEVERSLEQVLWSASEAGSGDDITLAIAVRSGAKKPCDSALTMES